MIRIILVDDHLKVRRLLLGLLESVTDFEVVGEADNGHECMEIVRKEKPDVVLTDLRMAGMDGLELTRELCAISGSIAVIVLTMYGEPLYLKQALEAGAKGYVLKGGDFEELILAIHEVSSGRSYVSPSLAAPSTVNPQ